jgi:hypothetical protein
MIAANPSAAEIGAYYCVQCNRLYDRLSPELHRVGPNLAGLGIKCEKGHFVFRVSSGWIEGVLGIFMPASFSHIAVLIGILYPLEGKLISACVPLFGVLCILMGLHGRAQRAKGIIDENSLCWRMYFGLGMGCMVGMAVLALIRLEYAPVLARFFI